MARAPLDVNPDASNPTVTGDARQGGNRPMDTGPELRCRHLRPSNQRAHSHRATSLSQAPSDPYVPLVATYGSSKPRGRSGVEVCWFFLGAGCPALAVRVDQAGAVRCARVPLGGHVLLGDRLAGDPVPLFPLGGAGWLVVGVQEQVPAQGAASVLLGEQDQDAAVEQGSVLAASLGPVVGQGGVVRRRRAQDQTVSDDLCPAEFR